MCRRVCASGGTKNGLRDTLEYRGHCEGHHLRNCSEHKGVTGHYSVGSHPDVVRTHDHVNSCRKSAIINHKRRNILIALISEAAQRAGVGTLPGHGTMTIARTYVNVLGNRRTLDVAFSGNGRFTSRRAVTATLGTSVCFTRPCRS